MNPSPNFENGFARAHERLQQLRHEAEQRERRPSEPPKNPTQIYDPVDLDSSRHETRLLTLHPGVFAEEIHCSLGRVSLDDLPDYEALSYTWGDPKICEPIVVAGEKFFATHNLEGALRQLRLEDRPRVLWIDAICINQQNIREREQQVAQMKEIYKCAKRVCVWLGDDSPILRRAMNFIDNIYHYFPGVQIHMEPDGSNARVSCYGIIMQKGSMPVRTEDYDDFRKAHLAYKMLEELPWWFRVWVVQELAMAQDAIGCLDNAARSSPYAGGTTLGRLIKIRKRQQSGGDVPLLQLLQDTVGFGATDPRDKIYAILGLAGDLDRASVPIDYSKSVEQLYIDVTRFIIAAHGDLEVITSVADSTGRALPSWVPDFDPGPRIVSNPLSRDHCASGDERLEYRFTHVKAGELDVLGVNGIVFDTISEIEKEVDIHAIQSLALSCLEKRIPDMDPRRHIGRRAVIWRTCIADRGEHGTVPASTQFMTIHEILADPGREIDSEPDEELFDTVLVSHQKSPMERFVKPFRENMEYATRHRNLFATKSGFIGLCPRTAEIGDLVVVLFGGHIPYVLRETIEEHGPVYKLIGEAFVHGIMYGQFAKLYQNQKAGHESIKRQEFLIV